MRILIVSKEDKGSGASNAANRLHKGLLAMNIESQMLVQKKLSNDDTVLCKKSKLQRFVSLLGFAINEIPLRLFYRKRKKILFSYSWFSFSNIVAKINTINPDIVHLNWICKGMIPVKELSKIKPPIVWTFHDNWGYTGGCHLQRNCEKYKTVCEKCPNLESKRGNDLSKKGWALKKEAFSKLDNLTIVGVSRWLTGCSAESSLLKNRLHFTFPNPININLFSPVEKKQARKEWKLPEGKKLILFGAYRALSNRNKGFFEFEKALQAFDKKENIEIVIFGSDGTKDLSFKTHYLGHIKEESRLKILYNACDVMVVPSTQESFGQTASEGMSCGTPVVAFGATGLLDIVDHKKNGYLATPFDTNDLKNGMEWVLNTSNYEEISKNAREKVVNNFEESVVSKKYIELYKRIIESRKVNS